MRDRDLLRLFTVGGDTFVDVGSQAGAWVFSLAKVFRRVIAVESNPGAAQLLRENLAHDGIGNVEVLEMAASNPLDPVLQGKIDLIRIDVEGFEVEVVRGLLKTIEVNNPGLCVKISNARNEIVIRDMLSLILFPGKDLQGSRSDAPQPHLIYARPT
jgi:predicted RNA methylase